MKHKVVEAMKQENIKMLVMKSNLLDYEAIVSLCVSEFGSSKEKHAVKLLEVCARNELHDKKFDANSVFKSFLIEKKVTEHFQVKIPLLSYSYIS
jgi:hypothetical protein